MITRAEKPISLTATNWCTRRGDTVRGPYPQDQISRYILLGRICASDEVRPDGGKWKTLSEYPQLIPGSMQLAPTRANRRKLAAARMLVDERRPGDRRQRACDVALQQVRGRRSGQERRQPGSAGLPRFHALRHRGFPVSRIERTLYRHPLVIVLLLVLGLVLSCQSH